MKHVGEQRSASYARVIIESNQFLMDKAFDYSIPAFLEDQITVGVRVTVPLGNREVAGYVIGLKDNPDVIVTKEIKQVEDTKPLFSEETVELAAWIASYYMCTISSALRCILPGIARPRLKKYWKLTGKASEAFRHVLDKPISHKAVELQILEYINKRGCVSDRVLKRAFSGFRVQLVLEDLQRGGLIEPEQQIKKVARVRKKKRVCLTAGEREIKAYIDVMYKRAPKQVGILKYLLEKKAEDMERLIKKLGVGHRSISSLVDKNLVALQEVAVSVASQHDDDFCDNRIPVLSTDQQRCLEDIVISLRRRKAETFLLYGVTGSGKTEIYIRASEEVCRLGKGVIVLLPEISLTPQTVANFRSRLGNQVVVMHSRLSEGERFHAWLKIKEGDAKVVIGARSAVFAPFKDVGLFILDEEHEDGYQQESVPKYHAREVALRRACYFGSTVILGSATPSLESYHRMQKGDYRLLELRERVEARPLPSIEVVDLRSELKAGNKSIFSSLLQSKIASRLQSGEQVLLFLNRRGYAGFIICRDCGQVLECPHCAVSLTQHVQNYSLRCHYCGYARDVPQRCPQCGSDRIRGFGLGTQRVEEELRCLFPKARIIRMDADNTGKRNAFDQFWNEFRRGEADVLIGTQMVAKGLDFPNLTLVGVITADITLNLPDFRAGERTFQLLTQVAGRSGRGRKKGEVVVQTYNPLDKSIQAVKRHGCDYFYEQELKRRRELRYPPFNHLVRVLGTSFQENELITVLGDLREQIEKTGAFGKEEKSNIVLGPSPANPVKLKDQYRWHLLLRGENLEELRAVLRVSLRRLRYWQAGTLKKRNKLHLSVDINPQGML